MLTAEELWNEMWPLVPWDEASDHDRKMLQDHANSLAFYVETQGVYDDPTLS